MARAKLALWYNEIEEFGYDTFTTVANSIENHYERILNYFSVTEAQMLLR